MISETKLDASFPTGQFHIQSFSELYKLDKNSNGGGLLVSVYLKYLLIWYTYVWYTSVCFIYPQNWY